MKLKKLLIFVLTLAFCLSLCACGEEEVYADDSQSKTESTVKASRFTVTVVDQDGNSVEGVVLRLQKKSTVTARSNIKGVATFPLIVTERYKLSVISCPSGYEYTGVPYIPIKEETSEFVLKITKK